MATTSFAALRDDSGIRSLSTNERDFLRKCALGEESSRILRADGRKPGELRKVQIGLGRRHNAAECTVQWGISTRVTALVTASLVPPSSDRLTEGVVSISVDLSPMASTAFGHSQPVSTVPTAGGEGGTLSGIMDEKQKLLSNRVLRSLERTLLLGGALDTEALCVQSGAWVWKLNVNLTVLDHGGNLLDASVLAAVAALRHYRKPQLDLQTELAASSSSVMLPTLIHSDVREPTPLPLHHTPLSVSFSLIHADDAALSTASTSKAAALVDPTEREELVQSGIVSVSMNKHSEVCLLDYSGGCELQPTQLKKCWKLAERSILQLLELLEQTLEDADRKAQQERLRRLQESVGFASAMSPEPDLPPENLPYMQDSVGQDFMNIDTTSAWQSVTDHVMNATAQAEHDEAEEAYRLQALDYSYGHVAAKVTDAKADGKSRASEANAGSLLAAMLRSAQLGGTSERTPEPLGSPFVDERDQAQDELVEFVGKSAAETGMKDSPMKMGDSDEEENTVLLASEFPKQKNHSAQQASATLTSSERATSPSDHVDDDIDDLAMAIKMTGKKKKKKKK